VAAVVAVAVSLVLISGCGGGTGSTNGVSITAAQTQKGPAATFKFKDDGTAPVLIGYRGNGRGKAEGDIVGGHGRSKRIFDFIPVEAADLDAAGIAALQSNPNVAYVEPDSIVTMTACTIPANVTQVKAPSVWSSGDSGASVKVAVLDTGVDLTNTDIAPNYKGGYNYIANTTSPKDDNGHGTEVAGTLSAAAVTLEGCAPKIALYAVKVLDSTGSGSVSNVIAGLNWAVTNKMQVVNMSLGQATDSAALDAATLAAYNANIVLVAAAGNSGPASGTGSTVLYPAGCTSVIAVGAVDANNLIATYSSTGAKVELVAPGNNIVSDKMGGGTITTSGTSLASPHVAGAAALMIAKGTTSAATIRSKLDSTATHLGTSTAVRSSQYGYGLVNCALACGLTTAQSK
jgi:subtilisin family serine protease